MREWDWLVRYHGLLFSGWSVGRLVGWLVGWDGSAVVDG
jgi:hypothetical protein